MQGGRGLALSAEARTTLPGCGVESRQRRACPRAARVFEASEAARRNTVREVLPDPGASNKHAEKREASLVPTAAGRGVGFHSASSPEFGLPGSRARLSRKGKSRAADTGESPRQEVLPESVIAGMHRPPRCILETRGAASRNPELGLAPSEAREGPRSLEPSPPPSLARRSALCAQPAPDP